MTCRISILVVTRNFPPLVGGMENVNAQLLRELSKEWTVALCGPEGSRAHAPEATWVSEAKLNPLLSFLVSIFLRAVSAARRLRPKFVLAGSGLTLPVAWVAARLSGAKLAVYLHGLDIIAPSRIYQLFWPRFIRRCDLVLVNSRSTAKLALARGADVNRLHILHPGTSIPELDPTARARFRVSLGLSTEPLLLSVGRLTKRKGLAEFVIQALPTILESYPSARLVIVGEDASEALTASAGSERERITSAAQSAGVGQAVRFIGRLGSHELTDAYQSADLHVFPVLQMAGDVEGFGMVALEAAAHGLRTVAFDVGGVPDAVEDSVTGSLVRPDDYRGFADAVIECLQSEGRAVQESRNFAREKSWDRFGDRVRTLVREVIPNV